MANNTERIGVNYCGVIAEKNKWMYREQPVNDVGIDAHMEMTDATGKSRQLLGVQVKTGESYFDEKKEDYVIFRDIKERQYVYWTENSLPCIIVLYNPNDDTCIWEKLTKKTIKKTGKGYYVKVPTNQVFLDATSNQKLLEYTNLPERVTNYNFLLSQKEFMLIIRNGGTVKLHSREWVNKSSGRGDTELIVEDGDGVKKYSYPYWFPFTPYTTVFLTLFPWATFSADDDFYEEDDYNTWREYNVYHDEDEEICIGGESFTDYRKRLDPMRYIDHQGEVAEYMLKMDLNDFGTAFLKIDDYLTSEHPYVQARPKSGEENED